jgi:uncharacterized protein (UPF0210 family)
MIFDLEETRAILRMIETEHLDIRTVTLGISLRGCATDDIARTSQRVYEHITRTAARLVAVTKEVQATFGVPIVNKRIAVTPIALVAEPSGEGSYVPLAQAMDRAASELGIDYIAGFSALVEKGMTPGDAVLIDSIPEALAVTERVCASINVASTRAGINMDAIRAMGHVIRALAENTRERGGIGCAKLVTFANMPEDNPFVAGANHGIGEGGAVINVGVSGPGVVLSALRRLRESAVRPSLTDVAETIKRMSFKITRAGELIGREVARRLGESVRFGIVDLSLAPTPARGDSVAEILEVMGLERTGCPGTTAALALLTDAVKKGGAMATSHVGGLSGAFIPVSEDHDMLAAVEVGALSLEKLEAMSAVCSVGLDMVAVPGDTSAATLSGILADEIAIGVFNNKTTAVRIIPVPGKSVGEKVVYGGLLGEAPIMPVSRFHPDAFVAMGGRIPAPIISLRN